MRTRLLLPSLFFLSFHLSAQHDCTAHHISEQYLAEQGISTNLHSALANIPKATTRAGGGVTIPTVVHVVWNTAAENVADQVIFDLLAEMNTDYAAQNAGINGVRAPFTSDIANTGIEFCLADIDPLGNPTTGITRTQTSDTWFDPDTETNDMKSAPDGIAPWDPDSYLNIWICDITSGSTGGFITVGYAYLPVGSIPGSAIDGLVVDYDYGTQPGAGTATHEVGHYLGLLHPWGDDQNPSCAVDDNFADTPDTDSPTYSCSNTSLMKCSNLVQYENFMDYSNCAVMFTNDQSAYMNSILNGVRSGLLNGGGCSSTSNGNSFCTITSAVGTSDGDFIDGVTLGSINNVGTGGVNGNYYTFYSALSTNLSAGSSYTITITGGNYSPDSYAAWIDFDHDSIFDATEKLGEFQTSVANETQNITFTVPATAINGPARLRVRGVFVDNGDPDPIDPCYAYAFGETEDYTINVLGGMISPCIPTSTNGPADGDFIDGVILGSISNTNTGDPAGPAYVDYTAQSTALSLNQTSTLQITSGDYQEDNYAAWIDYNQNGTFELSEKLGEFPTTSPYETGSITFTVPGSALPGNTIMRIRGVYHLAAEPSPTDPCYGYEYGETEDYGILIQTSTGIAETISSELHVFQQGKQLTIAGATLNSPLELLDLAGRPLVVTRANSQPAILDIARVPSGIYLVRSGSIVKRTFIR